MRTVQSWTCELGYGADTMFHRTYFLLAYITQAGTVPTWLNAAGSCKQRHTMAQGL